MRVSDEVGDLVAVADIEQDATSGTRAGAGQLLREALGDLVLDVGEHGIVAADDESTTDGRTDARGTSCDHGDAAHPSPTSMDGRFTARPSGRRRASGRRADRSEPPFGPAGRDNGELSDVGREPEHGLTLVVAGDTLPSPPVPIHRSPRSLPSSTSARHIPGPAYLRWV